MRGTVAEGAQAGEGRGLAWPGAATGQYERYTWPMDLNFLRPRLRRGSRISLILVIAMLGATGASAQIPRLGMAGGPLGSQATPHTEPSLIARTTGVQRGGEVEVALRLKLDPEWHVYWANPGDAGLPPKLKWTLPAGVSVSDIDWPAPHYKLDENGLITYLYEGDVVLPLTLAVDEDFGGEAVGLVVDASWLVCREACLPGKARLTLNLPVVDTTPTPNAATADLFAAADLRSPLNDGPDAVRRLEEVPGRLGFAIPAGLLGGLEGAEVTARIMPVDPGLVDEAAPHAAAWSRDGTLHVTAPRADDDPAPAEARGFIELHGNDQTLIFRFGPDDSAVAP